MTARALRLGTRRSPLAMAQATWVAQRLAVAGVDVDLVGIVSEGDLTAAPLASLGGAGVFVGSLRSALLSGDVDAAVHSLKDLPTAPAAGLVLAAVPVRADARDALCASRGRTLAELPAGARVGTGSPRRAAQLTALGFDLEVVAIRGNVGTRLALVEDGTVDAVVLAAAGLARLGLSASATEFLDPIQMLPAPGQGALGLECREDDVPTRTLLGLLNDADTRMAVQAERALLAALEAGCSAPVGALAEVAEGDTPGAAAELYLRAVAADADGLHPIRLSLTGPATDPVDLGKRLAAVILAERVPVFSAPGASSRPADQPVHTTEDPVASQKENVS